LLLDHRITQRNHSCRN